MTTSNTGEIRVTKIKRKDDRITVAWEKENAKGGWDSYSISSLDQPLPSFHEAIDALTKHVVDICELPAAYGSSITISGVSFSYANDVMGATITALKALEESNAPLVLNTPHKPSDVYSEGGDELNLLPPKCVTALGQLEGEAIRYVNGERSQTQFEFDGAEPAEPAEATA